MALKTRRPKTYFSRPLFFVYLVFIDMHLSLAERSKAWVCSQSFAGIAGSNNAGGMDVCQVEVSATGRSLVQRSPTACGVSLCVIK